MSEVVIRGGGPDPRRALEAFRAASLEQMERAMLLAEGEVARRAPFRTGHLRRSLAHVVRVIGDQIVGTVGTTSLYAPYLEMGTGLYGPKHKLIVPVNARALRFPAGGSASAFSGGSRRQGSAGPGFRLSGQQRAGKAGGGARYVYARSVKGIRPIRFFRDGLEISRGQVMRELNRIPAVAERKLLEGHR